MWRPSCCCLLSGTCAPWQLCCSVIFQAGSRNSGDIRSRPTPHDKVSILVFLQATGTEAASCCAFAVWRAQISHHSAAQLHSCEHTWCHRSVPAKDALSAAQCRGAVNNTTYVTMWSRQAPGVLQLREAASDAPPPCIGKHPAGLNHAMRRRAALVALAFYTLGIVVVMQRTHAAQQPASALEQQMAASNSSMLEGATNSSKGQQAPTYRQPVIQNGMSGAPGGNRAGSSAQQQKFAAAGGNSVTCARNWNWGSCVDPRDSLSRGQNAR